jgi:hypothetical protein
MIVTSSAVSGVVSGAETNDIISRIGMYHVIARPGYEDLIVLGAPE